LIFFHIEQHPDTMGEIASNRVLLNITLFFSDKKQSTFIILVKRKYIDTCRDAPNPRISRHTSQGKKNNTVRITSLATYLE
jgi:hypothetical protein